uniref:Uncharacterized protein n=1 Tax=Opuntia streptacantha TaxID=393608 RepID=A0A7C9CZN9_OPUST
MALPLIASMLGCGMTGILILLPLLSFLNSLLAGSDITIVEGEAGDSGRRRSTSDGVRSSRSTSGPDGGRFELHRAAGEGNLERVRRELTRLPEPKRRKRLKLRDANKQTPLSCAASNNCVNVVKYLVKELEKLGESIFSADMKDGDAEKSHPIHRACIEGHLDVVKILCSHCVDLKLRPNLSMFAPNHHGQTILHLAAENGHVNICKYLLTLPGCQVQKGAKDKNGLTPGDLARPYHDLAQILRQADTVAP